MAGFDLLQQMQNHDMVQNNHHNALTKTDAT